MGIHGIFAEIMERNSLVNREKREISVVKILAIFSLQPLVKSDYKDNQNDQIPS
jgi:hypothetical protein